MSISETPSPTTSPLQSGDAPATTLTDQRIVVVDFGSQYAQLIARRVREQNVYCQIVRHDISAQRVAELAPRGIILSGGPSSVYEPGAPQIDPAIFDLDIPVLGICYGMQVACQTLGGRVDNTPSREFGRAMCEFVDHDSIFRGMLPSEQVWMSHGDQVSQIADQFTVMARTSTCPYAAIRHNTRPVFGMQFHPEVTHTPQGGQILRNFVREVCGCDGTWRLDDFANAAIEMIREQV